MVSTSKVETICVIGIMTHEKQKNLSEEQIDEFVIAQAEDDSAWEEPIVVHRDKPATLTLQVLINK